VIKTSKRLVLMRNWSVSKFSDRLGGRWLTMRHERLNVSRLIKQSCDEGIDIATRTIR